MYFLGDYSHSWVWLYPPPLHSFILLFLSFSGSSFFSSSHNPFSFLDAFCQVPLFRFLCPSSSPFIHFSTNNNTVLITRLFSAVKTKSLNNNNYTFSFHFLFLPLPLFSVLSFPFPFLFPFSFPLPYPFPFPFAFPSFP